MTNPPYSPTGLHPAQVRALREHRGLSQQDFGRLFGIAAHQVDRWESEGLSTGPAAVALRAVASAWSFTFPYVEGGKAPCVICGTDGYHEVFELSVCRSCYLTPVDSMREIGYVVSVQDELAGAAELEVKAPPSRSLSVAPSKFGPEDWKTAVKKLRADEHQTGYQAFDDLVYIDYIEAETQARLDDHIVRELISDLVPHGELELIGDAARLGLFRRNSRPVDELVLRLGLLMARLCENA